MFSIIRVLTGIFALCRCLQEISYLTSPQAMNPLPQRQLTTNPSLQMQIPNAPPFEPVPFNGRPRKVMPDMKDYPILNGMSNMMTGPQTAPAASSAQGNPLDRAGILGSAILQSQQQPQTGGPLGPQVQLQPAQQQEQMQQEGKETEGDAQRTSPAGQLTAIFRDEDGKWQEKLREAHEQAQRQGQMGPAVPGAASWERRSQHDEEEVAKSEEEPEVEEEEGTEIGDGESGKLWKAKRTLRKLVSPPSSP